MDHPLYIAPDEEIISVIARLRTLTEKNVTLVFPKHSVVTQSIINLKLLAREGEKLQKSLTLVSQNENARSLAEKIGFNTLPYTQEMEKGSVFIQKEEAVPLEKEASLIDVKERNEFFEKNTGLDGTRLKSTHIGSSSFYTPGVVPIADGKKIGDIKMPSPDAESFSLSPSKGVGDGMIPPQQPLSNPASSLRVRNMSPDRPPSLNSLRAVPENAVQDLSVQSTVTQAIFPDSQTKYPPLEEKLGAFTNTPTAIKEFYNRGQSSDNRIAKMPDSKGVAPEQVSFMKKKEIPKKVQPTQVNVGMSKKLTLGLSLIVLLFLIALGSLIFFLIFPKATVTIKPQVINESLDQAFTVNTNDGTGEIVLSKATREITAKVAGIASGAAGSSSVATGRAKGTLKITNNFSSEPQPLVSSTRFESASGKIYRIQEAITVPGNGSIDAQVVADGTGASYNLSEGILTVPGFKGSDKFDKFSATPVGAISGGEGTETASSGIFIRADEETLRGRAQEEAKRIFTEEVNNSQGDTFTFTDGMIVERITETNLPKTGAAPGEYEYAAVFKVTAFTTSKDRVTKAMAKNIRAQYDGVSFTPTSQDLSFADFSITEDGNQASLKAHLEITLAATLDEEKIKADLKGKSATELNGFTSAHPEIEALSISFQPSWALKKIPNNPGKIELKTEF